MTPIVLDLGNVGKWLKWNKMMRLKKRTFKAKVGRQSKKRIMIRGSRSGSGERSGSEDQDKDQVHQDQKIKIKIRFIRKIKIR